MDAKTRPVAAPPAAGLRLAITGGGTAGHIVPGLAVADELRARASGIELLWIGAEGRRETDLVPREAVPIRTLRLRSLRRSLAPAALAANAATVAGLPLAVLAGGRILTGFDPRAVLATGGYASFPVAVAACLQRRPVILVEPNSLPGLTARLIARWAARICTAYPEAGARFGAARPVVLTGAPVRPRTLAATRDRAVAELGLDPARRTLLVMGGSLGAGRLNAALADFVRSPAWRALSARWQVLHSSGPAHHEAAVREAAGAPAYHLHAYIHRNDLALAAADLAVVRAGAMTLAEVTARGLPAVIVPWAGAAADHQTVNARTLGERGAALVIADAELTSENLAGALAGLMADEPRRAAMAAAAAALGRPEAARTVAEILLAAAGAGL